MSESKNTKCCKLVGWTKIVAGYFYEKVLDDKIITEITRYQLFLLTGIEEDNNLCAECLKYKKKSFRTLFSWFERNNGWNKKQTKPKLKYQLNWLL